MTLGKGLELITDSINNLDSGKNMSGKDVFVLYDTYGFPPDLTALILKEKGLSYNQSEFDIEMQKQKSRSRSASELNLGDWIHVNDVPIEGFVGYDCKIDFGKIIKYRKVNKFKNKDRYHIVFNKTPFYPEGGGQVGDSGTITNTEQGLHENDIKVLETKKENNVIIHVIDSITDQLKSEEYTLIPDDEKEN